MDLLEKIKFAAKQIVSDERLWTKEEWQAYKQKHPETQIKPKFKPEAKPPQKKRDMSYLNYFLAKKKIDSQK